MNNELEIMNVQGIDCYEKDGTAYLRLEDVARGLGFTEIAASGNTCIKWTRVKKHLASFGIDTSVDEKLPDFIPENIFYRLAMKAKNEVAEKFQTKVADEIIPSIRKHGAYMTPETLEKSMCNPNFLFDVVSKLKDEYNKRIELEGQVKQLNEENEVMKPKAEYCDGVLQSKNSFTTTQIAADVGLSARRLNKILHEKKIQYKVNGQWILYQEYKDKGYVQAQTHLISLPNGDTITTMSTEWTQKGRRFIYDLLKDDGIVPIREVPSEAAC